MTIMRPLPVPEMHGATSPSVTSLPAWRDMAKAALLGGVVAGTVDIGAACLINHRDVTFILHAIAGGLLGERSYAGGAGTAALGAALQEFMGVLIAAIFVSASRFIGWLNDYWKASGLTYGVVIFVVMNYVVVPLSAWHQAPHFAVFNFAANLAAMLLFGLLVSYFSHRSRTRSTTSERNGQLMGKAENGPGLRTSD
jgi:hypothetical protein